MDKQQRLIKAKIPCKETNIEIKHTLCDLCSPAFHCGVDAYVKDGKIIKVEGTPKHPQNTGLLCTKGLSNRQFVYREDRIKTPLRRIGERGSGEFQAISWDEAYTEIATKLNDIKSKYGAESVVFYSGYTKWYRGFLRRLCHSFGSNNYASESSTCMTSAFMAWDIAVGSRTTSQFYLTDVFLGWAFSPHYSRHSAISSIQRRKSMGAKVIIVDTRITPAVEQMADLYLRPKPGTDGALALGIGKVLIDNDWIDHEYVDNYVYGFEEYKEYVQEFTLERVEQITGVKADDIIQCARMISHSKSMAINESAAPIAHHINGMQNYRAIMALSALTGNYDKVGGQAPIKVTYNNQSPGFDTREKEFIYATEPKNTRPRIGSQRFPLWEELEHQCQANDIPRQMIEKTPYELKAIISFGMNARMFPDSEGYQKALDMFDFVVDVDLFMTDSAKHADIVLPACSSFERSELKAYSGGYLWYTKPVIEPLYDSKSDADIICDLANYLQVDDELLRSGHEECLKFITSNLSTTWEEIKNAELPIQMPEAKRFTPREFTRNGYNTPSGKFELYSQIIAKYKDLGLDPLPTYKDSLNEVDTEKYPLILSTGARIPGEIHGRLSKCSWPRSLRSEPMADISCEDAKNLGISQGDNIEIYTDLGAIKVKANISAKIMDGVVHMYHSYVEADVNSIIDGNHLDPYCGFPGYRTVRCNIRNLSVKAGGRRG